MICVMAHPSRAARAETLAIELNAHIIWDEGFGENDTGARAWQSMATNTDEYSTVIQDDAEPINDYLEQMTTALGTLPKGSAVSWYLGTSRPPGYQDRIVEALHVADSTQSAWLTCPQMLHGVAITPHHADRQHAHRSAGAQETV